MLLYTVRNDGRAPGKLQQIKLYAIGPQYISNDVANFLSKALWWICCGAFSKFFSALRIRYLNNGVNFMDFSTVNSVVVSTDDEKI